MGGLANLGLRISILFQRVVPDPFVIAIVLTFLTAVIAITFGRFPQGSDELWGEV